MGEVAKLKENKKDDGMNKIKPVITVKYKPLPKFKGCTNC